MRDSPVHIRMLGGFSITWNGREISDTDNRMRKVWLLLAYLICRRTSASQEEIIDLLWARSEDRANPAGALKTMFYRARTLLNQLGDDTGQALIIRRDGGYLWNPDIPTVIDVYEFEVLCQKAVTLSDPRERLAVHLQALELYGGDFLPKLSAESWAIPLCAYFHRLYLETAESALAQLEEEERWEDVSSLCDAALKIEPYSETLYQYLIRCRIAGGDSSGAVSAYEEMSELLFSHFGVMPSNESRALYRLATRSDNSGVTHISTIRDQLREEAAPRGAMFCEYDFFRMLYQAQARAIVRSGDSIHIALLTVAGRRGKSLARRSLDRAMENLKQLIIGNLRQGDIVTQCCASQFLVMLPQANYENSRMVCERLMQAFFRQYPHSPVDIRYSVHPLEPAASSERT